MTKLIAYNVTKDELPYFKTYADQLDVEYTVTDKLLTSETVGMAEGCDGVLDFLPDRGYTDSLLGKLEDFGIKYISLRTAGFDNIDFDLVKAHGIKVSNVPAYSPTAIAEFAVLLSLMLLRKMQIYLPRVKTQDFSRENMTGRELGKMTVGIIGTGKIGFEAAKIFKGFGARVIGFDKFPNDGAREVLEYMDDLNDLLSQSDIISLHIPLLPENAHIIDEGSISKMKDGVILINTARGGHMDFPDILRNLLDRKVGGLGIDVFEFRKVDRFGKSLETDIVDDRVFLALNSLPNVIITPHTAYNTDVAIDNMVKISTECMLEFLETGESKNDVTPK